MGGTYKDLEDWQKAIDLVIDIYSVYTRVPSREELLRVDLRRLRRAVVSIASNIAEGKGRDV